ncbi:nucleotidyltransferase domain-containing protein [Infirmifilum lucidum]|uniref:Nucleotidyltransferase domain-containing protein n=1 Tax=Infirmifilum lucidum TaxID=2776706 RepID=A0A7L9FHC9_9CREN|nr:nucleotidyltransferase domain-containing protein [Infirmifilum lucidum]QOJ79210.1 nucleotidyltransferase domain-containing protein [Infirmifilum lucidum]
MSEELLVREAKRRAEVFRNLPEYLKLIRDTVLRLDENAEIYLFGSVAEGRSLLSSDIDILVVTNLPPPKILAELWKAGIEDPFEIHVIDGRSLEAYKRRAKLVPIQDAIRLTKS